MPHTSLVLGLVEQDLSNKKFSQALRRLISVSNECSKEMRFLSLLSFTQKALGDHDAQIKTLEVIAELTQTHVAYLDFMMALYKAGRLNEALDIGLYLQEMNLNEVNAKYFTRMMINIYLEFSDYEGVHEVLNLYQIKYQMDDLMNWALGFTSLASGDKNKAIDCFRKTIALNPANDQAWISLAMLHEEMGDRELALANLECALDANPFNSTGLKLLSKWHHKDIEATQSVLNKLSYYLSAHAFDEEVSLCYVQLLRENNSKQMAHFEIEKLILNNPTKAEYLNLRNNFENAQI